MTARYCFLIATLCIVITGCGDDKKPVADKPAAAVTPKLMEPFRFHKGVEVSPGQTFDVLSWGRGASAVGAFAILHSDSAAAKYTTTTGDLDGTIRDVYNSDMDTDGNPEILIQSKAQDTINYAKVYAYEFNGSDAHKLDFPKLTRTQRKGYRGDDNFYIRDGNLIREFPIYSSNDSLAKPTGARRQLEYGLRGNEFTVTQLSKDSVDTTKPEASVQPAPQKKKQTVSKRTAKKRRAETRRHRRRRG